MLKAKIDKLEDVPQEDRKHYKKIDLPDGKVEYLADVEKVGGFELADTGGLLKSLERERANGSKLSRYGTITPEEAAAAVAKVAELTEQLEARKGSKGADADERVKQATAELSRAHAEALKKIEERSNARLSEVVRLRRTETALKEIRAAGFEDSAVELIAERLAKDIDVVEDEKGFRSVVRGQDGTERIVPDNGSVRPMTPADRAKELAVEFKRYLAVKEPAPKKTEPQRRVTPAYADVVSDEPPRPYNATEAIGRAFANANATAHR